MRVLSLSALFVMVLLAAAAMAARGWAGTRSERALATAALCLLIVLVPTHVLGWAGALGARHALTRGTLGGAVIALCVLGPALTWNRAWRAAPAATAEAIADLVKLPIDALALCARARSLALVGLALVLAIVAWTAYGAWLAPSSAWDGVFYHEAMVGFAIQGEGFAARPLPASLAPITGYPLMAECLSLIGALFLDRRVIELPGSPMLLVVLLGTYVLAGRWMRSRATAIGLASGLALLPGIVLQLRSTYIDTVAAGYFVLALAFATRPALRARDALLAGALVGVVGASKSTGFLLAPVMAAVLVGRVLWHLRGGARWSALAAVLALVIALGSPTYVRNWIEHENPLWPGRVHQPLLGIEWEGPLDVASHQLPFEETVRMLFSPPVAGQQYHDTRDNGYGNTPPFVVLPLALWAILRALSDATWGRSRSRARAASATAMLVTVLPIAATFALSPAGFWARLNLHVVIVLWVAMAWLAGRAGRALGEGVVGAVVIGGAMTLWWSEPAWDIPLDRVRRLAALAPEERALQDDMMITLAPEEFAREREALPDGALVVFSEHPFPAQLWNERFSNRVEWLRAAAPPEWLRQASERGATMVVVPSQGPLVRHLRADAEWREIGFAVRGRDVIAFVRRSGPSS